MTLTGTRAASAKEATAVLSAELHVSSRPMHDDTER